MKEITRRPLTEIPKVYDPAAEEGRWYDFWEKKGFFRPEVNPEKPPFTIVIPPPNITGSLHMGHALNNTLQDILIRRRRMQGYEALWLPGTDHASIATEVKVEEWLAQEGTSKEEIGREAFLQRAWEWREKYGSTIVRQLKKLGSSCDWSRERFTLDEGCSRAVIEVFVRLFEKGLIYRGDYITNWCPDCQTVISDIEVEHEEKMGHLWHIKYPLKDGSGHVTVATTRPESMLGDTSVAVNPGDDRYQGFIGKTVILPIVGREIPIIADEYVNPAFGTGAVKVTPAHDPNDFDMGERHNLPKVVVIGRDGRMTAEAGRYQGMDRFECRRALVEDLKEQGFLLEIKDHTHAVGHCYRCQSVVEPLVTTQWFVRMKPLAEPAIEAVKNGEITFVPERFTKVYLNWMENIRDWCISRQLWWGHRIPAWYCRKCGEITVARQAPDGCAICGSARLEQDPDVLDTWFSSALWPFSTLGWPEETPELGYFFPTGVLVTAYDIIFFWVARMIFSSLEYTGKRPFHTVLIHGLVRAADGRKMSKSLGNGIDPLDIIDQYGADALRFSLVTGLTPGNDMRFYMEKVEGARNFANKLWNAARFVLMNLEDFDPDTGGPDAAELSLADRWIISRYNRVIGEVDRLIDGYELGEAARSVYDFLWNEYCDWYIELAKPRLYGKEDPAGRRATQATLHRVLEGTLRLLHPFMPFVTEAIWQNLPHAGASIMVAPWPRSSEGEIDESAERAMAIIIEATRALRNLRAEFGVAPGKRAEATLIAIDSEAEAILREQAAYIQSLTTADLTVVPAGGKRPAQTVAQITSNAEIHLSLKGLIDLEREIERLNKDLQQTEAELEKSQRKLSNEGFLSKAAPEIVERERGRATELAAKARRLQERLALFDQMR
ncbi:MAG: valine--tRNA ligase [Bacillota bacterium]